MEQNNRKYRKNNKLTACLLLVLFVIFSAQLPYLNKEMRQNSDIAGHVLVGLQETIATNSFYQAPVMKHDMAQHRVVLYFPKSVSLSASGFNSELETLQKHTAEVSLPPSNIPVYLFDRVLRI